MEGLPCKIILIPVGRAVECHEVVGGVPACGRVSEPFAGAPGIVEGSHRTSERERDETPSEHADRNFAELVQELRVAQTGVQILFAFLLTLAFYESFPRDNRVFDYVLAGALLAAACSALCFMAPVSAHRLTFRQGGKERLVWVTHGLALVGLALLAIAMLASIWLVLAYLFTWVTASATVAALAFLVLALWVVIPLRMRTRR